MEIFLAYFPGLVVVIFKRLCRLVYESVSPCACVCMRLLVLICLLGSIGFCIVPYSETVPCWFLEATDAFPGSPVFSCFPVDMSIRQICIPSRGLSSTLAIVSSRPFNSLPDSPYPGPPGIFTPNHYTIVYQLRAFNIQNSSRSTKSSPLSIQSLWIPPGTPHSLTVARLVRV